MSQNLKTRHLAYFAAPLFSEAELRHNLELAHMLERHLDVYLPQRDGGKLVDLVSRGVPTQIAYKSIFDRDIEAIHQCDALILLLDGRTVDEGAAFELGVAFSLGKICVGLQTDPRRLLPLGNNPMIECALKNVFKSSADLAIWAEKFSQTVQLE